MKLVSGSDEQSQQVIKEEGQTQEKTDQTQTKESEKPKPPRPKGVRILGQPHKFRDRSKLESRKQDERFRERRSDWRGQVEYENNWKDKGRRKEEGERRVAERRAEIRRKNPAERRIKLPRPGRASDNKAKFAQPEGTVHAQINEHPPDTGKPLRSRRPSSGRAITPALTPPDIEAATGRWNDDRPGRVQVFFSNRWAAVKRYFREFIKGRNTQGESK
jgi:hypothetical protein